MVGISQVAPHIYQIGPVGHVFDDVMVYLVTGQKVALIEAGPGVSAPLILEALQKLEIEPARLAYIIPTHIHIDHVGGAGLLAREIPWARVVAHPRAARHLIDPTRLIAATRQLFGNFESELGPIHTISETQLLVAQDGETISLGTEELKIVYSPGHAPHHICIFDMRSRGLFCGEALGCYPMPEGNFVIPGAAPPDFDLELYLETIGKLEKLEPEMLFYSHDGVGHDAKKLIQLVRESVRAYADIVLPAMRAGDNPGQITKKLEAYVSSIVSRPVELTCPRPVQGYMAYFERNGLAVKGS
ncbi:MAG: beta lactamase-like protein [Dehalococcoidia bacterium]|nr:beta lactamase-like protein [Dehalococcoidia bacterium]